MNRIFNNGKRLIEVKSICKSYINKKVLNSISFEINDGDIIYLSGINGSGKTTTLKILAGIIKPNSGEVLYQGETLFENPKLRNNIGYMTTELMFYETLTVEDNLNMFGALFNIKDVKKKVSEIMDCFDITDYKDLLINEISSGMKRKFQLAAATINSPKILILDEPFNTLDEKTVEKVLNIIKNYTVIFSTHDRFIAKKIATRELNLVNGQVQEVNIKND